jgi:hypothetical protein
MKFKKVEWWTWKSDVKYYLLLPFTVFNACICWCRHKSVREEMFIQFNGPIQSLLDTIGLFQGMLDCKCGRMYRWVE